MTGKPLVLEGRAWVIPVNDIDTDMIYHNAHLAVTDVAQMGRYAFKNLTGWESFPERAKPGDILLVGENFGCGSSRQHAVDCFKALGVSLIVAESFGAIYRRNAINSGMPILTSPAITTMGRVNDEDTLRINLKTGMIENLTKGEEIAHAQPASAVQLDIYHAGDLFTYGQKISG